MTLAQAQQQFISSWGAFSTYWGINRTMAQIHALLLISPDPISQDDIMVQLHVSRGNANMNVRELIDWGLVDRVIVPGERKEYYTAEKDIYKVATQILQERKKRELAPMVRLMDQLDRFEGDPTDPQVKQFKDTISGIKKFGHQADRALDIVVKADENWFVSSLLNFLK